MEEENKEVETEVKKPGRPPNYNRPYQPRVISSTQDIKVYYSGALVDFGQVVTSETRAMYLIKSSPIGKLQLSLGKVEIEINGNRKKLTEE